MTNDTTHDEAARFIRLVACVATVFVLQLLVLWRVGATSSVSEWSTFALMLTVGVGTAVSGFRAGRRDDGPLRSCWRLVGAGATTFVLATLGWRLGGQSIIELNGRHFLADAPAAVLCPFLLSAFVIARRLPNQDTHRTRTILDSVTVASTLMFLLWLFALRSHLTLLGGTSLVDLVTLLDAMQLVAMVTLTTSLLTSARPVTRLDTGPSILFSCGLVVFTVAQVAYFASEAVTISGAWVATGWALGVACFGVAFMWPNRVIESEQSTDTFTFLGEMAPALGAALVLSIVVYQRNANGSLDFVSELLGAGVIVLVLVRQVVTSIEERRAGLLLEEQVVTTHEQLNQREQQFSALVQHSSDVIVILDPDGNFAYLSPSIEHMLGYEAATFAGGRLQDIVFADDQPRVTAVLAMAARRAGASLTAEWRVERKDGSLRQLEVLVRNLLEEDAVGGIVLNVRDVTERKTLEEQLTHQALHDDLTGLANRSLLRLRIEQALGKWLFQNEPFCLLVVDLDDFKAINDSLGHVAGDTVLKTLAERIGRCTRRNDTLVRLGSDEFAVLLEGVAASDDEAHVVARRIIDSVQQPIRVEGHGMQMRASIGLACVTEQVNQADDILRNADLALHTAKHSHRGGYVQFELTMHDSALRRVELEGELRHALENDEFQLFYQPTVDIATGGLEGVEALIRWPHPEKGFVSPADFIPIAEESGLIVPIGLWVLKQACNELAKWQLRYPTAAPLRMNVNISGRQLDQPDFVGTVRNVIDASGIARGSLVLEMTESVLMENRRDTVVKMQQLVELGCELAMDDFGTGYSSLSYLRQFPIGILKIDRAFVNGLGDSDARGDAALVQAIVDLARTLRLRTVAEGIETIAQLDELRRMGCDVGQGFLLARPAPAEEIRRIIESTHAVGAPLPIM